MIAANLPALQVVVPLLSAPICALLRGRRLAWAFAVAITWIAFAIAVTLLSRVMSEGVISYAMGNWAAPWGIEYRIDQLNALVLVIVTGIGALVAPAALRGIEREIPAERAPLFFTLFLLSFAGLLGITITGDAFNLYVFLEIASLSSYALVALGPDRRALTAAYRYLVLGTIGATFILIGVGILYMMTGTLNMADLANRLVAVNTTRAIHVAFAFIIVGAGLKLALFPLHMWLPNAYTFSPAVVSAFLAATATKVGVYVFIRFVFTIFGPAFSFGQMPLGEIMLIFGLLAAFVASIIAIFQNNLKRMLAYSSVAQLGYMALGIGFASVDGLIGTLVHLFNHALMKGALFMALACMFHRLGSVDIGDIRGLGRRMPLTMAAFVVGGLSLIGLPATVGFISKWYFVLAALDEGLWPIAVAVLLSSMLAMVYIGRVIEAAYFQPPPPGAPPVDEAPWSMLAPTLILAGASIYFGLNTDLTVGVARAAAVALMGLQP